jgi:hypothetical protein
MPYGTSKSPCNCPNINLYDASVRRSTFIKFKKRLQSKRCKYQSLPGYSGHYLIGEVVMQIKPEVCIPIGIVNKQRISTQLITKITWRSIPRKPVQPVPVNTIF